MDKCAEPLPVHVTTHIFQTLLNVFITIKACYMAGGRPFLSLRRAKYQEINAIRETVKIIKVAKALILGETPIRTEENTTIGKVVAPGPDVKLAMTKSSSERLNDNSQPAIREGEIIGTVM